MEDQKSASSINSTAYRDGGFIAYSRKYLEQDTKHLNDAIPAPSSGWQSVDSPFKSVGIKMMFGGSNLIQISRNEFIIALTAGDEIRQNNPDEFKDNGIYKYNVDTKKWSLIMEYPSNFFAVYHNICYDDKSNCLFIQFCRRNL